MPKIWPTPEQEGILEDGGTVFFFDGLQITHIIGELCAESTYIGE